MRVLYRARLRFLSFGSLTWLSALASLRPGPTGALLDLKNRSRTGIWLRAQPRGSVREQTALAGILTVQVVSRVRTYVSRVSLDSIRKLILRNVLITYSIVFKAHELASVYSKHRREIDLFDIDPFP